MRTRKRIRIVFIIDDKFIYSAFCSASISINSNDELLEENYCEDIEDLEYLEFIDFVKSEYENDQLPSELDITSSDITQILEIDY